jgi:hypothetical protein
MAGKLTVFVLVWVKDGRHATLWVEKASDIWKMLFEAMRLQILFNSR